MNIGKYYTPANNWRRICLVMGTRFMTWGSWVRTRPKPACCFSPPWYKWEAVVVIEAISVMSEHPQDGGSGCCCYDYRVNVGLQNCLLRCILLVIGCVMSGANHTKQEYPQDDGHRKKKKRLTVSIHVKQAGATVGSRYHIITGINCQSSFH